MALTKTEIFTSVREELLGEARQSPGLLADLANLERYIAETYSARSFIELLQNADDARAKRFLVTCHNDWLICANDGCPFSRHDFYSLCRSAFSEKQRGQTIGYRGIGFKSVVGVCSAVHLISGELEATFSREITQACLGIQTPTPLVRIPHPLSIAQNDPVLNVAKKLERNGYKTIFILGGLDNERVQDEFDQFDADYLLFLRNITEAVLSEAKQSRYRCEHSKLNASTRQVSISAPDRRSFWLIQNIGHCDIAFSLVDGVPVPLNAAEAIAHAFLPTLESTGFGIRINADFSTDLSRTRIVFDDVTSACTNDAASALASMISEIILSASPDNDRLACLMPTVDLSTLSLQKRSFKTELIAGVRNRLAYIKDEVSLAPTWLNHSDVQQLASTLNRRLLPTEPNPNIGSTQYFMRYLGVQPVTAQLIVNVAVKNLLSTQGCAEIISYCRRNVAAGISLRQLIDKPIWMGAVLTKLLPLRSLVETQTALAADFVEAIQAAGVTTKELAEGLKAADLGTDAIAVVLPGVVITNATSFVAQIAQPILARTEASLTSDPLLLPENKKTNNISANITTTSRSLPAWRGAEQYVTQLLESHGYRVEDRSRQNLGYDLYVEKPGRKHYIEVKLLDYAGQPFIITTNEEAVARECGVIYIIALTVRTSGDAVHIQFIHDPVRTLKFVRQCRQWVWECSEYDFNPTALGS
jgi:hypothetical protein